jgi:hypothetical protein
MLPLHQRHKIVIFKPLNIQTLKLAPVLAEYLYSNKRLDLPGIGIFLLDNAVSSDSESIRFESNHSVKESPGLIEFISAQTGKMKALAAADLSSHLELAQQFLNIGKPFLLEGIGSLVKIRQGEYSFSGADIPTEKLKDQSAKEAVATSATEESFSSYEPLLSKKITKLDWKKPALVLFTLIGTGLAIWGGYSIYKRTASKNEIAENNNIQSAATTLVTDSSAFVKKDTNTMVAPVAAIPSGTYKFVLETAQKARAFSRYNTLKTYQWNVQMETKDSSQFKLYLLLPVIASDTTRIMDSLTALNGRRVYIEK